MTELIRGYTGHLSGMRFDSAVINLEEVKTSSDGKSFHFLVESGKSNLINGDPVYRFSHYIENSILKLEFSGKTDAEIASEIFNILSQ
ncbi:hypothetical protein AB9Q07_22640 [Klebsiella quasipneumoniae]|uniref:hypothetical protein n=1 Tax=Klebsiella quasipneumoniae TaxID=1463165 RepID=UPI00351E5DB1